MDLCWKEELSKGNMGFTNDRIFQKSTMFPPGLEETFYVLNQ